MIEIKRILCPTDFSDFSRRALEVGLALAKWYDSEVSVVHVMPRLLMPPEEFPYVQEPVTVAPKARENALSELGRFVHAARESGITTEVVLEEGETVSAILNLAKKLLANLIVMGTHGRSGVERLFLGSVTEKVLRKSPVPVLTVPRGKTPRLSPSATPFKKILCPVDFSSSSLRAVEFAISLAREADAKLTLMNVVEWAPDTEFENGMPPTVLEYRKSLELEAHERLRKLIPDNVREFCEPEEVVLSGRPHREILEFADAHAIELIVMGVHGRSALDLLVFGSQTQYVVRGAKCPVLTIRSG